MFDNVTLFRQLIFYLPQAKFKALTVQYGADRYVKSFDTWSQFLVLLASQIKGWSSLREIETGFKVRHNLIYHLGIKSLPKRSNMSKANTKRNSIIFEKTFYELLSKVMERLNNTSRFLVHKNITVFDSTIITVSLEMFEWATFRKDGGFKIHTAYSVNRKLPLFINVTHGNINDITGVDRDLDKYRDSIVVMDRGYSSGNLFSELDSRNIHFVTRLKSGIAYRVLSTSGEKLKVGVLSDQIIKFTGDISKKTYLKNLRLVKYYDKETKKEFHFLTNNFNYSPKTIAYLYKKRWEIELFFKWIKQNLIIKDFFGTSENAVRIQVWVSMTAYILLHYVHQQCNYTGDILSFTRVVREMLFEEVGILDIMQGQNVSPSSKYPPEDLSQLSFPTF